MPIESSTNFRRIDDRLTTSGAVPTEDLGRLGEVGYEVVINLMPDDSPYAVAGEAGIVTGQGVAYVPLPVDFEAPTQADLDAFFAAMDANRGRMTHVHCAVNARVSAFVSLYLLRAGRWSIEEGDSHIHEIWDPADYPAWQHFIAAQRARITTS